MNTLRGFKQKINSINKQLDSIERELRDAKLSQDQLKELSYLSKIEEIIKAHPEAVVSVNETNSISCLSVVMSEITYKIKWYQPSELLLSHEVK